MGVRRDASEMAEELGIEVIISDSPEEVFRQYSVCG